MIRCWSNQFRTGSGRFPVGITACGNLMAADIREREIRGNHVAIVDKGRAGDKNFNS